jgi:nondiscriminating aspartyl-tRNA synthetase
MKTIGEYRENGDIDAGQLAACNGNVTTHGMIHKIRRMSGFAFVILRTGRNLIQCVYTEDSEGPELSAISEGCSVRVEGVASHNPKVMNGAEILVKRLKIMSVPAEAMPIVISRKELDVSLDTSLNLRPVSLRNQRERAIFKIQEGIVRGFRDYLLGKGFTEIRTPKIVFAGAEGGANIFKLDYFGKQVYLAQSPQFYKQVMVGVYERVFEVGAVYRAEKHDTSRHLNEYVSMDLEMGFINDFTDIMSMEVGILRHILGLLENEYKAELDLFPGALPECADIPALKFMEAKGILEREMKREIIDYSDFEPEEEQAICDYVKKKMGSEFVFITHYPSDKRPFYAMDDPANPGYTASFDLLFRGIEITTGGQRIHDYGEQVEKMLSRGLDPEDFKSYLMIHKYGMPPHGGFGAGLERLTMKLLGFSNVRYASLFPRDTNRVTP